MPITTRYVLIASMDIDPAYEDLFNEVYDQEHAPNLLAVAGVRSVARLKGEPFTLTIAHREHPMPAPSPIYTAIYEIDHPDVLRSPAFATALELGRWASEVRPHTRNRQHAIYAVRQPG